MAALHSGGLYDIRVPNGRSKYPMIKDMIKDLLKQHFSDLSNC